MGIGEKLREAREANGFTLEDIQEKTKIQKRYLQAIEQENYEALPGKFYARAFIKEYAQIVGLNANLLLEELNEDDIQTESDHTIQYTRAERSKRVGSKSSVILSFLPTFIVILLIVGIVFIAIMLSKSAMEDKPGGGEQESEDEIIRNVNKKDEDDETDEPSDEDESDGSEEEEDEPEEIEAVSEFKVLEVGQEVAPLSTVEFNPIGDKIIVMIEGVTRSYIDIRGEQQNYYYADTITSEMDI